MLKKITGNYLFIKISRNPFLLFLPFFFFYAYLVYINKWPKLYGDEIRYVAFGRHLLHGFYSPPMPHIDLWNGPGYPLLLVPFLFLKIHGLYITMMNAVYLYLTLVFLYKAITLVASRRVALTCTLLLAFYPNAQSMLPILYTEAFTGLLISSFIYCVTLSYTKKKLKYVVIAGLLLGYLTLTKIIFGYVILFSLIVCLGLLLLFKKNKADYLKAVYMLLIAFAVTVPYLGYTYHLTGKVFYWGNSGGMSLYWMSSPYENEYGDWKLPELTNHQYPIAFNSKEVVAILKKNHAKEIKFILNHNEIEQDQLFKQIAINNIKEHPLKFISNYGNNISRMLFNFPYSYSFQNSAIVRNILIGSLILWATVAGIILTVINWSRVIAPVKLLLLITTIYLGLSGALSAYPRQLDIIIPVLLFWLGFLKANTGRLSFKFTPHANLEDISLTELAEVGVLTDKAVNDITY